eukprot:507612_1
MVIIYNLMKQYSTLFQHLHLDNHQEKCAMITFFMRDNVKYLSKIREILQESIIDFGAYNFILWRCDSMDYIGNNIEKYNGDGYCEDILTDKIEVPGYVGNIYEDRAIGATYRDISELYMEYVLVLLLYLNLNLSFLSSIVPKKK